MSKSHGFLRIVLLSNGIVDIVCAVVLIVLPELGRPLMGYHIFDGQGALMAGGWGMTTLALGLARIWASGRDKYHRPMLLLGELESILLALFTIVFTAVGMASMAQAALPMAVGVVFGVLYVTSALMTGREGTPAVSD
jgi:hypothetical protein